MAKRKNYPFDEKSYKQMNRLVSRFTADLLVAPFVVVEMLSKSSNGVAYKKKEEENDAFGGLLLCLLFITPLYVLYVYIGFSCGLFLFPIIGEFALIGASFIFFGFWWVAISELIKAFKKEKKEDLTNKEKKDNNSNLQLLPSGQLLYNLSKDTKIIKQDYSEIVKSNIQIKHEIEELYSNIEIYKGKLKKYGFIPTIKERNFRDIKNAYREINYLTTFNKIPISIDESNTDINGHVYLDINNKVNSGKLIDLDNLERKKKEPNPFYAINKEPILSLPFNSIELYLFNDAIALITKDEYVVIDPSATDIEFRTITVEVSLANKDEIQFNVLDTQYRHISENDNIDSRNKKYHIVEIGVLELTIVSQKINLLFSNTKSGYSFYKSLFFRIKNAYNHNR